MPTYDYECDACGHAFEKFQTMSSDPIKKCPKCGKNKVRRLIGTGAGLIFKGSGFYITDYRDQGYADKAKAESNESKGETKTDGGTSSDSKPSEAKGGESKGGETKPAESKPSDAKPAVKSESKSPAKSSKPKK